MSRSARFEEIDDDGSIAMPAATSRITEVEDGGDFDDDFDMPLPDLPNDPPIPPVPQAGQHTGSISQQARGSGIGVGDRVNPNGIKYVEDDKIFRSWLILYPIYFDTGRSIAHGRRVGRKQGVASPLAKTIADACKEAGFNVVFEPQKTHPADWSNPGRVRIQWRLEGASSQPGHPGVARDAFGRVEEPGRPGHPVLKTRKALYGAIADYLRAHPTGHTDPFRVPVPGFPTRPYTQEQVEKGEDKMGKIYRSVPRATVVAGDVRRTTKRSRAGKKTLKDEHNKSSTTTTTTTTDSVADAADHKGKSVAPHAANSAATEFEQQRARSIRHGNVVNTIVPLHSPARSGGGINSDMFKGLIPGLDGLMGGGGAGEDASAGTSGGAIEGANKTPSKKELKKPKMRRQIIRG